MELRPGEVRIDHLDSVEDSKDPRNDRGRLVVTNLRIMWTSHRRKKSCLSVGYGCFIDVKIKKAVSKLRGTTQALFVKTKYRQGTFEFIFTSLVKSSPRIFVSITQLFRSYESSRLYRDLKLRGAIVRGGELVALPSEEIYSQNEGVWNLSTDKGNLGTLIVSNIRVVWFAAQSENFNASIPYMQIENMSMRDSKYGVALVINTTERSGGFTLGFRVDPQDKLPDMFKEMSSLWRVFAKTPIFGVRYTIDAEEDDDEGKKEADENEYDAESVDIIDDDDQFDAFGAYLESGESGATRDVVYDDELGLAIEAPPDGLSVKKLWSIITA